MGSVADRGGILRSGILRVFLGRLYSRVIKIRPLSKRRDVTEQVFWIVSSSLPAFGDDFPEMFCVPVNEDGSQ